MTLPSRLPTGPARLARAGGRAGRLLRVPVGELPSGAAVLSVLSLLGGTVVLAWSIVRQLQRLVRSRPGDDSVRLDSLAFFVILVVPMFAATSRSSRATAASSPFETKTTLYFTLSTLATVGFGDVHATGQVARVLVTVQITFDLVFVAALVSVVTGLIRERAAQRRAG